MSVPAPHFLLYTEAAPVPFSPEASGRMSLADASGSCEARRWRFVLRQPGGETTLEATDEEHEAGPERLELLAVIRGLEALVAPSRVTLLTGSRQIRRGLDSGLPAWRENAWQWERYGRMTPVKNSDLWQRLDRLLAIHAVRCQPPRLENADDLASPPPAARTHGTTMRIDAAHRPEMKKSEIRSTKSETNSKLKCWNDSNSGFGCLRLLCSNLFRISCFVLRISARWKSKHRQPVEQTHVCKLTGSRLARRLR